MYAENVIELCAPVSRIFVDDVCIIDVFLRKHLYGRLECLSRERNENIYNDGLECYIRHWLMPPRPIARDRLIIFTIK